MVSLFYKSGITFLTKDLAATKERGEATSRDFKKVSTNDLQVIINIINIIKIIIVCLA